MESNQQSQIEQQEIAPYTEFFSWGSDQYGQLALANPDDDIYNNQPQFSEIPKSLSFDIIIKQISCGENHAGFISGESFVFCVGRNQEGQLGVGDPALLKSSAPLLVDALPKDDVNYPIQISCGGNHSAVVMKNGELYTWGQGAFGATGLNSAQNTFGPILVEFKKEDKRLISQVSSGKRHTLIIDVNGTVLGAGENNYRQLGIPHYDKVSEFTPIPDFPYRAKQVEAGIDHSLILTVDNNIYSVGNNKFGNLGLGHTYSSDNFLLVHGLSSNLQFKAVRANRHSAALTEDGRLFVWGQVFKNEQPLLLPQELKSNKAIIQIAIGDNISAIIDDENHVYSWGLDNRCGQLGRLDDEENQDNGMPQIIEGLVQKQVTQIAIGGNFCIALGLDFDESGNPIFENQQQQNAFTRYDRQVQDYQPGSFMGQERIPERQYDQNVESNFKQQKPQTPHNYSSPNENQTNYQPSRQEQNQMYNQKSDQSVINQSSKKSFADNSNNNYQSNWDKDNRQASNPQLRQNAQRYESNERQQVSRERLTAPTYSQANLQSQQPASSSSSQLPLPNSQHPTYVPSGTSSNVELYKQLDQLRQENFELKQKQRELMQNVNILRAENEQLLVHTDEEIKRMSDFVDKFTQEVDITKRQIEDEYEQKLRVERQKNEELRVKMHQEQSIIDKKLDNLQKEIELLKHENSSLKNEKQQANIKLQQAVEQNEKTLIQLKTTEQQLQKLQSQEREKTLSPNSLLQSKYQNQEDSHIGNRTPGGYNSRPPVAGNTVDRISHYQRRNEQDQSQSQFQTIKSNDANSYNRFHLEGADQKDRSAHKNKQNEDNKSYNIDQRTDYSPYPNQRGANRPQDSRLENQTPSRYTTQNQYIYSPMRQRDQDPLQQSQLKDNPQQRQVPQTHQQTSHYPVSDNIRENSNQQQYSYSSQYQSKYQQNEPQQIQKPQSQTQLIDNRAYQRPTTSNNYDINYRNQTEQQMSPNQQQHSSYSYQNNQLLESNASYQKYDQAQLRQRSPKTSNAQSSNSRDNLQPQRDQELDKQVSVPTTVQATTNAGGERTSALNDVKNRLMVMQKNKEELEEKLRNYEAKIRQHFNKQ